MFRCYVFRICYILHCYIGTAITTSNTFIPSYCFGCFFVIAKLNGATSMCFNNDIGWCFAKQYMFDRAIIHVVCISHCNYNMGMLTSLPSPRPGGVCHAIRPFRRVCCTHGCALLSPLATRERRPTQTYGMPWKCCTQLLIKTKMEQKFRRILEQNRGLLTRNIIITSKFIEEINSKNVLPESMVKAVQVSI